MLQLLSAAVLVLGAESAPTTAPAAVSGTAKAVSAVVRVDEKVAAAPLGAREQFRTDPVLRGERSSLFVAQARGEIRKHFHRVTEETIYLIRGEGTLALGDRKIPLRAGDAVTIPAGVHHAFVSTGKEAAIALSFFAPSFDGTDREFVNE